MSFGVLLFGGGGLYFPFTIPQDLWEDFQIEACFRPVSLSIVELIWLGEPPWSTIWKFCVLF